MPFFILRKEKIKKICDEDFYDFEVTDTEGLEDTHNVFVPVE